MKCHNPAYLQQLIADNEIGKHGIEDMVSIYEDEIELLAFSYQMRQDHCPVLGVQHNLIGETRTTHVFKTRAAEVVKLKEVNRHVLEWMRVVPPLRFTKKKTRCSVGHSHFQRLLRLKYLNGLKHPSYTEIAEFSAPSMTLRRLALQLCFPSRDW